MNKRLQKKRNSLTAGLTRKGLREKVIILHGANDVLLTAIEGLRKNKDMLDKKVIAFESNLKDCKLAHVYDFSKQEKEICKLKARNKTLADANTEISKSMMDVQRENQELEAELFYLKNRTLMSRILNKGANN